jgi:hypothetical protein
MIIATFYLILLLINIHQFIGKLIKKEYNLWLSMNVLAIILLLMCIFKNWDNYKF